MTKTMPPPESGHNPHKRYPVKQTADLFGIPPWKLWKAVRAGILPSERLLNGRIYLKPADIEAALSASNRKEADHA